QSRILELYPGCLNERLVGLDGILQLPHLRLLGLGQLWRSPSLGQQLAVTIEIGLCVRELSLIAIAGGDRLVELSLVRSRINLGKQVADTHRLSLGKGDLRDLSLDLAAYDDRVIS